MILHVSQEDNLQERNKMTEGKFVLLHGDKETELTTEQISSPEAIKAAIKESINGPKKPDANDLFIDELIAAYASFKSVPKEHIEILANYTKVHKELEKKISKGVFTKEQESRLVAFATKQQELK
jgi:hypothetical protein